MNAFIIPVKNFLNLLPSFVSDHGVAVKIYDTNLLTAVILTLNLDVQAQIVTCISMSIFVALCFSISLNYAMQRLGCEEFFRHFL